MLAYASKYKYKYTYKYKYKYKYASTYKWLSHI
jgi:hypothetical protein